MTYDNQLSEIMKNQFVFILIMFLCIPVASAQLSGAWVEDISYNNTVDPNDIVTVSVTIGFSFENETDISPGIYSKELDDWVVDDFVVVNGTGEETYVLEFPAPGISGTHEYEANVYYFTSGNWFHLGKSAVQNITLLVQGEVTSVIEFNAEIGDINTIEIIEGEKSYQIGVTIIYDFDEETEVAVVLTDSYTGQVIETLDTIEGEGSKAYTFDRSSPPEDGSYDTEISVSFFNGTGWDNSGAAATRMITLEVVNPTIIEPPIEPPEEPSFTYIAVGGVIVVGIAFLFYMRGRKV